MWDDVRQHNYKLVREVAGIATQPEKANSCDDLAWYDILTSTCVVGPQCRCLFVSLKRKRFLSGRTLFVCMLGWEE